MSDQDQVAHSSAKLAEVAHRTISGQRNAPGWKAGYFTHGEDAPAAAEWLNRFSIGAGEAMILAQQNLQTVAIYYWGSADDAPSDADAFAPTTEIAYRTDSTIDRDAQMRAEANLGEMIDEKRRIAEKNEPKKWRWCGNAFGVRPDLAIDSACALANQPPAQGPSEVMFYFTWNYNPPPFEHNMAIWLFY
jgi:hypothetical protein